MPSRRATSAFAGCSTTSARAALDDAAVAKDDHVVSEFQRLFDVVRHQQHWGAEVHSNLPDDFVQLRAKGRVKASRGSSSRSTEGFPMRARAMEHRCLDSPLTSCGRRPATSAKRNCSSMSLMRRWRSRRGMRSGGKLEVATERHVREQRVVLKNVAAVRCRGESWAPLSASKSRRSSMRMRPRSGLSNPAMQSRVSVFPAPLGPNRT